MQGSVKAWRYLLFCSAGPKYKCEPVRECHPGHVRRGLISLLCSVFIKAAPTGLRQARSYWGYLKFVPTGLTYTRLQRASCWFTPELSSIRSDLMVEILALTTFKLRQERPYGGAHHRCVFSLFHYNQKIILFAFLRKQVAVMQQFKSRAFMGFGNLLFVYAYTPALNHFTGFTARGEDNTAR